MKLLSELKIGDKLEIEPLREDRKILASKNIIVSQLLDMKENNIYISSPILKGLPYPLFVGNKIRVIFLREDKGIFSFTAEINKKLQGHLMVYVITPITEAEKTQRRIFFRLDITRNVIIKPLGEEEIVEGATKDISGGGMKIIAKKTIQVGKTVECALYLSDECLISTTGIVVRCVTDTITGNYQIGISFKEGDDEGIRNKIVSFIFEKQRELRKKGLI